ncbi:MAG: SpoIIE family protein phosphatase [Spirochaetes bacterium]|nr:SpoIIE family protein phosphatase [Spirochaetota bacterium]
MQFLEDADRRLTIRDVASGEASSRFRPLPDRVPNFGHTHSVIWLRFDVENHATVNEDWFLVVDFPMIDLIELYVPGSNGSYRGMCGGESAGPGEGEHASLKPVFPVHHQRGKKGTYYIRYHDEGAVVCPTTIWEPGAFAVNSAQTNALLGFQYGIIFVMILYNLFLFFTVRDKGYLYYILFVTATSLVLVIKDGIAFMYLLAGPDPLLDTWLLNRMLGLLTATGMFLFLQFARTFLDTRVNALRIDMVLRVLMRLLAAAGVLFFFIDYMVISMALNIMLILSMILIVFAAVTCFIRGIRSSRFFILALVAFLAGILLYVLKNLGLIPSNLLTEYSIQIGNSLQLVILSLALGDRINIERREKLLVREKFALLKKELDIARKIQETIIPVEIPRFSGSDVAVRYRFYEEVGGDFFDFIRIDGARFGVFIADVSGHGIPAALISSMLKISLTAHKANAARPAMILEGIYELIVDKLGGHFVTASYAFFDMESRTMLYSSAGHVPAYIWKGEGGPMARLESTGRMLSALSSPGCSVRRVTLGPGDRIVMYTDGITENRNGDGIFLGEDRLVELLDSNRLRSAAEAADVVMEEVLRWGGIGARLDDDAMIILLDVC